MKKLFSKEKVAAFLHNVADLMLLNVLTIICSIPIITIGVSYTAMHYVLTKWDDDKKVARDFFKAWKSNFLQATIIWVICLVVFGFLAYDLYLIKEQLMGTNTTFKYVMIAITVIVTLASTWTFILQSRYDDKILRTIKNSLMLGFARLGYTFVIAVLYILPLLIAYLFPQTTPAIFLLGIATAGYLQSKMYRKVFEKLEDRNEESPENMNEETSNEE